MSRVFGRTFCWPGLSLRSVVGLCLAAIFVSAEFALGETSPTAAPTEIVSVRLRPLKGVISVSGTNLAVGDDSRSARPGFSKIKIQFGSQKHKEEWSVFEEAPDSSGGSDLGKEIARHLGRRLQLRGDDLRIDLRPAPSHVQLVVKGPRSPIHLVGFLDLESYLEGVVASEVPGDWPIEALKAQAVAARSFTRARVRESGEKRRGASSTKDWMLESTVVDQVFDFSRTHSRASEAVRATRGEVLIDGSRRLVKAHYHADCGGRIDLPTAVWASVPRTSGAAKGSRAIVDASCAVSDRNSWRFVSSMSDLSRDLRGKQIVPSDFEVASLAIVTRTRGGRAETLAAKSVDGREYRFSGERLRAAIGYSEIRSTLFDILSRGPTSSARDVEIVGRGFGHGAGLCQWGSRQHATSGKTYREILAHYYPNAVIQRPVTSL